MANSADFGTVAGIQPAVPSAMLPFRCVIDTYATGGVTLDSILAAVPDADFDATNLKLEDIYDGKAQLFPNAAGLLARVLYNKTTRAFVFTNMSGVELAAGAITALTVDFVGFLQ